MKLSNGMQSLKFQHRVASPYDLYNVGEVAGFVAEEAEVLLRTKTRDTQQPVVTDYLPISAAEVEALIVHTKSFTDEKTGIASTPLIDKDDLCDIVDALVGEEAIKAEVGAALKQKINPSAPKAKVADSKPAAEAPKGK